MQAIRDDITKAMNRGKITMIILADFLKAFDTIGFKNLILKMNKLGFCKDFLMWTLNYTSHIVNSTLKLMILDQIQQMLTLVYHKDRYWGRFYLYICC